MSYTELADSTAMLKTALRLLNTDADDDIERFKQELEQQIQENETEMDAYDKIFIVNSKLDYFKFFTDVER